MKATMKVLIIGSGGREHALAWKLKQSPRVRGVIIAPGNAGTEGEPGIRNVAINSCDIDGLLALAKSEQINLTVVGPEAPLVLGIVDRFQAQGLRIFGPCRAAAQLEASKAFAKNFLRRYHIPTADYRLFTELGPALMYVRSAAMPIVIKADGLAAGKGVVVAVTVAEAETALYAMLGDNRSNAVNTQVVIEEFLQGEEVSYMVICDGDNVLPLATSRDYKRRDDGDTGPNTGGMGAYSPATAVTAEIEQKILATIIKPTVAGMTKDGCKFRGFLYAGLMISPCGKISVLEFNVRLGDPETQPILLRLQSDLVDLIEAAIDCQLGNMKLQWDSRAALGIVLTAYGYPALPRIGDVIYGLDCSPVSDIKIFHAGTRIQNDRVVTSGGRVLTVCALGEDLKIARTKAYAAIECISIKDGFYRRDIAHHVLQPSS